MGKVQNTVNPLIVDMDRPGFETTLATLEVRQKLETWLIDDRLCCSCTYSLAIKQYYKSA